MCFDTQWHEPFRTLCEYLHKAYYFRAFQSLLTSVARVNLTRAKPDHNRANHTSPIYMDVQTAKFKCCTVVYGIWEQLGL